jgi:hypothetical protein
MAVSVLNPTMDKLGQKIKYGFEIEPVAPRENNAGRNP